jgi:hypothetical protein
VSVNLINSSQDLRQTQISQCNNPIRAHQVETPLEKKDKMTRGVVADMGIVTGRQDEHRGIVRLGGAKPVLEELVGGLVVGFIVCESLHSIV